MVVQGVGEDARRLGLALDAQRQGFEAFSRTQALNGDRHGPVMRRNCCTFVSMNSVEQRMTPPRHRPWPSMCFVAE